eukprot:TRINITY_DN1312_c0_g1_i2.p1 TRINITY_DN1312_c0_g1~~TRINITY_DN1312_c0_g1_i2.p1  ORF type:complete len:707 (+),score=113.54 TRINITY_DN1312_c0_g1_i2:616-2736(+)
MELELPKWMKKLSDFDPTKLSISCTSARSQSNPSVGHGDHANCYGDFGAETVGATHWSTPKVHAGRQNDLILLKWDKPIRFVFNKRASGGNAAECAWKYQGKVWAIVRSGVSNLYYPYINYGTHYPTQKSEPRDAFRALFPKVDMGAWLKEPGARWYYPYDPYALSIFNADDRFDCLTESIPPPRAELDRASGWYRGASDAVDFFTQKEKVDAAIENPSPPPDFLQHDNCPLILSHRGAGASSLSPENGFLNVPALAGIASGIEVDTFYHPGSNELYAMHDESLTRLMGLRHVTFTGSTREQLKYLLQTNKCRALVYPLRDVLFELKRVKMVVDIELKPGDPREDPELPDRTYAQRIGRMVGSLVRSFDMHNQVIVSSFDGDKLRAVNEGFKGQRVPVAHATFKTTLSKGMSMYTKYIKKLQTDGHVYHYSLIDKDVVDDHHAKGQAVGTYTIYDLEEDPRTGGSHQADTIKKLVEAGVDWMETDNPRQLADDLSKYCRGRQETAPKPLVTRKPNPKSYTCPKVRNPHVVYPNTEVYGNGYCWYLGQGGKSCDEVCKSVGGHNLVGGALFDAPQDCYRHEAYSANKKYGPQPVDVIFKERGNPAGWTGYQTNGKDFLRQQSTDPFLYGRITPGGGIKGGSFYGNCARYNARHTELMGRDPSQQQLGILPGTKWVKPARFCPSCKMTDVKDNAQITLLCPCFKPSRM